MDLIGYHYTEIMEVTLSNGRSVIYKGIELEITEDCFDEADLHYFKSNPKKILKGERVVMNSIWQNFYGRYIRCTYKDKTYDIKLQYLKTINK